MRATIRPNPVARKMKHNVQVIGLQTTRRCPFVGAAGLTLARFTLLCARVWPFKEGVRMTLRHRKQDPLADVIRSQHEEIKKYKWIESQKAGRDIGWERAEEEWLHKHFPEWKRDSWKRAIEDALDNQEELYAGEGCLN
jgi:hypothetical protein